PRAQGAVGPVLGGDGGEVLGPRAVIVHPPLSPQGEVGGGEDRRVDLVPPGAPARTAAARHVGHLVECQGQRHRAASRRPTPPTTPPPGTPPGRSAMRSRRGSPAAR